MRALMMLVATSGLVLWAALVVRDRLVPHYQWSRRLREGIAWERREAAGMLGAMKGSDLVAAIPALAGAMDDEDESVVQTAILSMTSAIGSALQSRNLPAARMGVAALIAASKDSRPGIRKVVIRELGGTLRFPPLDSNSACADAVLAALSDPEQTVRAEAAAALRKLAEVGSGVAPEALLSALRDDPSVQVRVAAAQSLGRFRRGRDRITLVLLHALESDAPEVQKACGSALFHTSSTRNASEARVTAAIVPDLIRALASPEILARNAAASLLGEIGPAASESIPALLAVLKEEDKDAVMMLYNYPLVYRAAVALGEIAPGTPHEQQVIAALLDVLREPTPDRRYLGAVAGLERFGPEAVEQALPLLLELLDRDVRKNKIPDIELYPAIARLAPGTPWVDKAVAGLSRALDEKGEGRRMLAAEALGKFGAQASSALPRLRTLETEYPETPIKRNVSRAILQIEAAMDAMPPK
jgi:HEAT repeat protein